MSPLFAHASKNYFLLFCERPPRLAQAFVRHQSRREERADGVVFLFLHKGKWVWRFFNPDGSRARMCGNAARVVLAELFSNAAEKVFDAGFSPVSSATPMSRSKFSLLWNSGKVVDLQVAWKQKMTKKEFRWGEVSGWRVNSGNPHLVLFHKPEKSLARKLRKKWNSNVTFVQRQKARIRAVTFERGVEDFTLSCGTGAVAAAFACGVPAVQMPGGLLRVKVAGSRVSLRGPVQKIRGPK